MTLLAVDPGLAACGVAVVVDGRLLHGEVIRTKAALEDATRIMQIAEVVAQLLTEHPCEAVAIETQFGGWAKPKGADWREWEKKLRNMAASSQRIAAVRGAVIAVAGQHGLPVFEIAPASAKVALAGYGRASKRQVQKAAARFNGGKEPPQAVADAIAVAVAAQNKRGKRSP